MAFEALTRLLDMVGSDVFEKNLPDNLPIRKPSIRNPQHGLGIVIGQARQVMCVTKITFGALRHHVHEVCQAVRSQRQLLPRHAPHLHEVVLLSLEALLGAIAHASETSCSLDSPW